ncbi:PKD domain-containing protein [Crocinitomix catalasitica]|uniref:PKD domain-containing protein n=1 Tax=Crocinitomix catalasitica TaxID=184607 RepID=UPI0004888AB3|nr:PKD domain-containing protein [Crocinitomix catalasitica]
MCCFSITNLTAQIVDDNAYLIGTFAEVAVHGEAGHEGTADWADHNSRGGNEDVPFGFVANPIPDGWVNYNGEYLTAGTPENGFGIEINGRNYSNNAWNPATLSAYMQEIPKRPGTTITHTVDASCRIVEWQGVVENVIITVRYQLKTGNSYYKMHISLENTGPSTLRDVYYYRNIDPDNNHALTDEFNTTNTIISQPGPDCIKSLVIAQQSAPWNSFLGLGSLEDNFRVSHGGFANRSGSDIWNATGLNGDVGDRETGDFAISIAYKTDIAAGETVDFNYVVVTNENAVEDAFKSMYYLSYETENESGEAAYRGCIYEPYGIVVCPESSLTAYLHGPFIDQYEWSWEDSESDSTSAEFVISGATNITAVGTPISDCLSGTIVVEIRVAMAAGPPIDYDDPGQLCGFLDLDSLFINVDGDNNSCVLLTEQPMQANQTEPAFLDTVIRSGDIVYISCTDTLTGCYSFKKITLNFTGEGSAGPDSSGTYCSGAGTMVDLSGLLGDTANLYGRYEALDIGGTLNDSTGIFSGTGLLGEYRFYYIVDGKAPCPNDTALFTITLVPSPNARFYYEVNGLSSLDSVLEACINDTVDFFNTSYIDPPQVIDRYSWDFADGTNSAEENPRHRFTGAGNFAVTLYVFSENGCAHAYVRSIKIYSKPNIETIIEQPQCFGDTNGSILVTSDIDISLFDCIIMDEFGTIINDGNVFMDNLGPGKYYIELNEDAGCNNVDSVLFRTPNELDMLFHIGQPKCLGDSGYVVIDSVSYESLNNPITYEWIPNPAGIGGLGADSSYWMKAGDYSVIATDAKGCTISKDFKLVDPPLFYFTEWGWDTAYCRLYNYQSGNGIVYAAAAGGIPNYHYEWTYDYDGTISNNSTWGGRNPGNHTIRVTDAGGCVLTKVIHVDSVNPIASFTMYSTDLNEDCEGTAPIEVEFTNTSQYYANPNNPIADTTFFWDLDRGIEEDWIITHDFYEKFDTIYEANGESYNVTACLIAMNKNGCRDTVCKTITIFEPPIFTPINVFTPNGGGENDYFTFEHFSKGIDQFNCIIVNRWGIQVGEINDIRGYWDGLDYRGMLCTDGVYFYTYVAIADNGTKFEGQGNVTIVNSGRK